ncbi:Uncharacterised protein [Vibrio cholerae]|nr:Uncharacterised protein [Vibrio cholerae]CSB41064.1 Uncharacterised protein [Vibrio cholerae]
MGRRHIQARFGFIARRTELAIFHHRFYCGHIPILLHIGRYFIALHKRKSTGNIIGRLTSLIWNRVIPKTAVEVTGVLSCAWEFHPTMCLYLRSRQNPEYD